MIQRHAFSVFDTVDCRCKIEGAPTDMHFATLILICLGLFFHGEAHDVARRPQGPARGAANSRQAIDAAHKTTCILRI